MKKLIVALTACFVMSGTAATAFAHDPGWGNHQGWKKVKWNNKNWKREQVVQYREWSPAMHVMHPPVREARPVIHVPAPPLPGIHFFFPDVRIQIH